jgi:hypothetical protein
MQRPTAMTMENAWHGLCPAAAVHKPCSLFSKKNLSRILQKLTFLEIACYRLKDSAVLWLTELQIRLVERFRRRYIL